MSKLDKLLMSMIEFYAGDPKRIQHFLKVHDFAALISRLEGADDKTTKLIEAAAYVHDIGIKPAEEKYGSSMGKYQETEGAPLAEKMLLDCGFDKKIAERVSYLVGHHHTYDNVDGLDYRILIEADFLVNAYEDKLSGDAVIKMRQMIFRTKAGCDLLNTIYGV